MKKPLRKSPEREAAAARACVIGWPVAHSRSPLIHGYWLRRHGIAGSYEVMPVRPAALEDFLEGLPRSGLRGCNVTIPHKERAFEIISRRNPSALTPMAKRLGAVNTIWLEGGRLRAGNTDAHGFMAALARKFPDWRPEGRRVLLIGAGGAARAVAAGLAEAGAEKITVANRTPERAARLTRDLGGPLAPAPLSDAPALMAEADILINATSLGMSGRPPLRLPLEALSAEAIVADIVYVPPETELLRAAAARGLRTMNGLGMLMHQAAPGFEKWFGRRPEVTPELERLLEADIASC